MRFAICSAAHRLGDAVGTLRALLRIRLPPWMSGEEACAVSNRHSRRSNLWVGRGRLNHSGAYRERLRLVAKRLHTSTTRLAHVLDSFLQQRAFHGGSWSSNPVGSGCRKSIPQSPGGIGACGAPCRHEARCQSGDGHHDECRPERQRIARADVVQEISK